MWKYAVVKTKGNDEEIVRWCESRDEAMLYGAEFFLALPKGEGIVSVEKIPFDEQGRYVNNGKRICHVWF